MCSTVESDWLKNARIVKSPNCDERPDNVEISLIVIHGISLPPGEYGGNYIDDFFTNRLDPGIHPYFQKITDLKVSSHLLIRRNGDLIQYVPFSRRAWHAGISCYEGCEACNDFSIGIELEGQDDEPYTDRQYIQLEKVIPLLRTLFPAISGKAVVGHNTIAPGRKTDPGAAFDWSRLARLISSDSTNI